MCATEAAGSLERALGYCAASAVAYKAAFMLARGLGEERDYLELCRGRYALLEQLLDVLEALVGPAPLRGLIERLDVDPSCYADIDAALAAAFLNDRELCRSLAERPTGMASAPMPDGVRASVAMASEARVCSPL